MKQTPVSDETDTNVGVDRQERLAVPKGVPLDTVLNEIASEDPGFASELHDIRTEDGFSSHVSKHETPEGEQ